MKSKILILALIFLNSTVLFSQASLPEDFESGPYTWVNFDGGVTTVIANPQSDGFNPSANVAQQVRTGGQIWGGSWILLDTQIDFTTNNLFKMKVYSPTSGTPVLFKIEHPTNGAINIEKTVNTSVSGAWEELTWDFTGAASGTYQKIVIIFNMGTVGAGETYLFDDIQRFAQEPPLKHMKKITRASEQRDTIIHL